MQRKTLFALFALAGAVCLSSCSAAQGLAKTLSRTTESLSRTVNNAGGALMR
jgi:hypothetical protein